MKYKTYFRSMKSKKCSVKGYVTPLRRLYQANLSIVFGANVNHHPQSVSVKRHLPVLTF